MNGRQAKILHKKAQQIASDQKFNLMVQTMTVLISLPLHVRLKIAFNIIFKTAYRKAHKKPIPSKIVTEGK